ncbi:MAG: polysaccharide pyruvyl transferase family protein [Clostridia bacterium]|nr:polysaccharide pyruvyl transferase family protein [Clostridia bacterium]
MENEIFIYGYFGMGNLGDDLIMLAENEVFSRYAKVRFLANKGAEDYLGKFTIKNLLWYMVKGNKKSLLIIGGGGLFPKDDYKTALKYLFLRVLARTYIFFGIGVDPLQRNSRVIQWIFAKSGGSIFRDSGSRENAGIKGRDGMICADVVPCFWESVLAGVRGAEWSNQSFEYAIVPQGSEKQDTLEFYKAIVGKLTDSGNRVVLVPFKEPEDRAFSHKLKLLYPSIEIASERIEEKLSVIRKSQMVISQRFHGVILALLYKKKFVPVIYDHKFEYLLDELQWELPRFYLSLDLKGHLKRKMVTKPEEVLHFIENIEDISYQSYQQRFDRWRAVSRNMYEVFLERIFSSKA